MLISILDLSSPNSYSFNPTSELLMNSLPRKSHRHFKLILQKPEYHLYQAALLAISLTPFFFGQPFFLPRSWRCPLFSIPPAITPGSRTITPHWNFSYPFNSYFLCLYSCLWLILQPAVQISFPKQKSYYVTLISNPPIHNLSSGSLIS